MCGVDMSPGRIHAKCNKCLLGSVPDNISSKLKSKYSLATPQFNHQIGAAPAAVMSANEQKVMMETLKDIRESIDSVNRINEANDRQKRKEAEEPKLKLYEVSVWDEGALTRPTSTVVVLNTDKDSAANDVIHHMNYTDVQKFEVKELTGPFHAGYIVSYRTLP